MKFLFSVLFLISVTSCSQDMLVDDSIHSSNNGTSFAQPYYDSCTLLKPPPLQYQYALKSESPLSEGPRELLNPLDSILYVKINGLVGKRHSAASIWSGVSYYVEDLYECDKLGFFEVTKYAEDFPEDFDFSNFDDLRYAEFHFNQRIGEEQLTSLLMNSKKLEGLKVSTDYNLPDCICELEHLRYLELHGGMSDVLIPYCLSDLPNLEYLRIVGGRSSFSPAIFQNSNLQVLDIEGSGELIIPEEIKKSKSLRQLSISGFSGVDLPDSFGDLDALELLEFRRIHNDTLDIADQLNGLINLQGVKMVHVKLKEFPVFDGSDKLKFLEVSHLDYLDNNIVDLTNITDSLEVLVLGGDAFYECASFPVGTENAKKLRFLHLTGFPIKSVPESISDLQNLQSLWLYGSDLDYESHRIIYGTLHRNGLRYFNPSFASNLNESQRMELRNLDKKTQGTLSNSAKPPFMPFDSAFSYYANKIKYKVDKNW